MTTTDQEVSSPPAVASPWLTVPEAAGFSRHANDTIRKACRLYEKTGGKQGLKSDQPAPFANRRIHREDLALWMRSKDRSGDKRTRRAA